MRSPKDMRIIQIDITNACINKCSNCTRFCGHHKKNSFMDWETFKKAVRSLKDFGRTIGIMGGEPTLHPQFQRFVEHIAEEYPSKYDLPGLKKPINNFIQYIRDRNFYLDETLNDRKGPGLWTSMCNNYYEHYELIQDVFSYQTINDHQNPCLHQPLLISRKELGISDDEWIPMRDNCWIQNMWSASITPKGAFFCEVAGALDTLFDGPGGWPVEPGWWEREPKDFGNQLQWCEICGGALLHQGRLSNEEIDDISPMLYERLKEIDSPKLNNGKFHIIDIANPLTGGNDMPETINRYLPDYKERISKANMSINPRTIDAIIFCDSNADLTSLHKKVTNLADCFESIVIAAMDAAAFDKLQKIKIEQSNIYIIPDTTDQWGRTLNKAIGRAKGRDWYFIIDANVEFPLDLNDRIKKTIINPGVLYRFNIPRIDMKTVLFNKGASSIEKACFDGISSCNSLSEFINLWQENKQVTLEQNFDTIINPDLDDWYVFAEKIDIKDKTELYKTLDKIKNDGLDY
ncbi:MAG: radical SAM protein [Lutisporaceae bacterium]